jgi:molecular chaperone HscB
MADGLFGKNYFEIFNAPVAYEIDLNRISGLYRELQKSVHPDRFAHASDQEKRLAMQQTSLINQAFQTLKDPILRAQYLLQLQGMEIHAETDTTMDGEFLMEQMEIREAIAEVRDKADPLAELDKLAAILKNKFEKLSAAFTEQHASQSLKAARETVRKMQFVVKAQSEIHELVEELENEML